MWHTREQVVIPPPLESMVSPCDAIRQYLGQLPLSRYVWDHGKQRCYFFFPQQFGSPILTWMCPIHHFRVSSSFSPVVDSKLKGRSCCSISPSIASWTDLDWLKFVQPDGTDVQPPGTVIQANELPQFIDPRLQSSRWLRPTLTKEVWSMTFPWSKTRAWFPRQKLDGICRRHGSNTTADHECMVEPRCIQGLSNLRSLVFFSIGTVDFRQSHLFTFD